MEYLITGKSLREFDCLGFACGFYCEDFDTCALECELKECALQCSALCGADCSCYQIVGGIPVWLNSLS
mgnify:CR=1 FL=1